MRFTVIHMNRLTTLSRAPIINASHQGNRHASTRPQPTPMGVRANNMGFAILIQGCRPLSNAGEAPASVSVLREGMLRPYRM